MLYIKVRPPSQAKKDAGLPQKLPFYLLAPFIMLDFKELLRSDGLFLGKSSFNVVDW